VPRTIIINNFIGMTCTGIAKVLSRSAVGMGALSILLNKNKCYDYCVVHIKVS
jgi:hypothetical protein